METFVKAVGLFVVAVLVTFLVGAVLAIPTMLLVNIVLTPTIITILFGSVKIGFWKAFGLNLLIGFLFGRSSKS